MTIYHVTTPKKAKKYRETGHILNANMGKIDGITLKHDTWYKLVNGEFVEVEGE